MGKRKLKVGALYKLKYTLPANITKSILISKPSFTSIYNCRFEVDMSEDHLLDHSYKIGTIAFEKDLLVLLEDGYDMFNNHSPKILTTTGLIGYLRLYHGSMKFIEINK